MGSRDVRADGGPRGADAQRLRAGYFRLRSALFDRVTGLSSYCLHIDDLKARARGARLGVLVVEFPGFGRLEAAHGWEAGDRFLSGVASLLDALRGPDLPDRTILALDGACGSTFLLFLPEGPGEQEIREADLGRAAEIVWTRLEAGLEGADWAAPLCAEFSIGYALIGLNSAARFERLVSQGIQEARAMTLRARDRLQGRRSEELREILRGARLRTHYQPIVDMERDAIVGYEALARGPENTRLEVPEALFACSDAARLSGELDALCRSQAVRNARGFDPHMKLFVNVLPEALKADGFQQGGLGALLEQTDLKPRNIVLEITERYAIMDFEAFSRDLGAVRQQGFLVAIDDVGTGYSSLHSISEVQPDFLKVDISLIKNIHQSLIKQHLVHSLLQVGSRIGARVIAEGIESEEEYKALRSCAVRYGQGFYFARPAPAFPTIVRRAGRSA
ncbi:MAG: EAL domain-containing protein [Acidobacteriota bacterium]